MRARPFTGVVVIGMILFLLLWCGRSAAGSDDPCPVSNLSTPEDTQKLVICRILAEQTDVDAKLRDLYAAADKTVPPAIAVRSGPSTHMFRVADLAKSSGDATDVVVVSHNLPLWMAVRHDGDLGDNMAFLSSGVQTTKELPILFSGIRSAVGLAVKVTVEFNSAPSRLERLPQAMNLMIGWNGTVRADLTLDGNEDGVHYATAPVTDQLLFAGFIPGDTVELRLLAKDGSRTADCSTGLDPVYRVLGTRLCTVPPGDGLVTLNAADCPLAL